MEAHSVCIYKLTKWKDFEDKIAKKEKEAETGSPACRIFMKLVEEFDLRDESNFISTLRILLQRAMTPLSSFEEEEEDAERYDNERKNTPTHPLTKSGRNRNEREKNENERRGGGEEKEREKERGRREEYRWYDPSKRIAKKRAKGDALYFIGKLMEEGLGVQRDILGAIRLYEQAVLLQHDVAACTLGVIYNSGKGVEKDERRARDLYELSAAQGNPAAQNNLGLMYENGTAVEKDFVKAAEWYARAAGRSFPSAESNLGHLYEAGLGVAQDDQKAVELFERSASRGETVGLYNLAFMYENGRGVRMDLEKAFALYEAAARDDYATAMNTLGWWYRSGKHPVEKNDRQACHWFHLAAMQEEDYALANIAIVYAEGTAVAHDMAKATQFNRMAAEKGNYAASDWLLDHPYIAAGGRVSLIVDDDNDNDDNDDDDDVDMGGDDDNDGEDENDGDDDAGEMDADIEAEDEDMGDSTSSVGG